MKRFFGFLIAASMCGTAALAQSTMPAYGANTPKGQVAKTDASINPRGEKMRGDSTRMRKKMSGKGNKMKMKNSSSTV